MTDSKPSPPKALGALEAPEAHEALEAPEAHEPPALSKELSIIREHQNELKEAVESLEQKIHDMETQYLEETYSVGNIVHGWEYLLENGTKKGRVAAAERIFSLTSAQFSLVDAESSPLPDGSLSVSALSAAFQNEMRPRNKKKRKEGLPNFDDFDA